jgi:NADH dehydrogenase
MMELEKRLGRNPAALFTPMLHEVAASDLDLSTIVNAVPKILRHVHFFAGQVERIDLGQGTVVVSYGFDRHRHTFPFDLLVISLGSVTSLYGISGLEEHALTMETLEDAMHTAERSISN